MKLMYPDALTEQESIGAPLDTHHLDKEMKDGLLMVNAATAAIRRFTTLHTPLTPTGLFLYKDPECHHTIGASSVIIFLYQHEDPECHHPTLKYLFLGLNHLNG